MTYGFALNLSVISGHQSVKGIAFESRVTKFHSQNISDAINEASENLLYLLRKQCLGKHFLKLKELLITEHFTALVRYVPQKEFPFLLFLDEKEMKRSTGGAVDKRWPPTAVTRFHTRARRLM